MSWIAVGVGVGSAGLQFFRGRQQKKQARQMLSGIEGQEVPAAALENKRIAERMAGEGMPAEQYAMAKREIDRSNVAALAASNSRRGGLSLIPRIVGATNDAYLRLNANNAMMRNQNLRGLMGVNSQIGGYQNKKYEADYNYGHSLLGAGNENMYGAIDTALSGIGGGLSDYLRTDKIMNSMGNPPPTDATYQPSMPRLASYGTGTIDTGRALRGRMGL